MEIYPIEVVENATSVINIMPETPLEKECVFGGENTYRFTDIGKTLFPTREEAEAALERSRYDTSRKGIANEKTL